MTKLSCNVNKVATLRNTRQHGIPSVVNAAHTCLTAGAHGITVHPRPDQRHITPDDVREIAQLMRSWPGAELNIEGNPFESSLALVREFRPTQYTMVPDASTAVTSDHGWDLALNRQRLEPIIGEVKKMGVRVSLFMDGDSAEMGLARELGADRVELYTEPYASAFKRGAPEASLELFARAAAKASAAGLAINAGHDLDLHNLGVFLKAVPGVLEVSIGHALISDAMEYGLAASVKKYLAVLSGS